MKILITDDHPVVRRGIRHIIAEQYPECTVDEAPSGSSAFKMTQNSDYDLVVMDISLPDENGIDLLRRIKERKPALPVLMMSILPEEHYAIRALKSGASGYLPKESAPDELINALRKVLSGGIYVSQALGEQMAMILQGEGNAVPHETLSEREFQIMRMIASGKKLKTIGEELSLSIKTVSTHRTRILSKMKMNNNAELTAYALQNRLI